jgi:hypothetical protein
MTPRRGARLAGAPPAQTLAMLRRIPTVVAGPDRTFNTTDDITNDS